MKETTTACKPPKRFLQQFQEMKPVNFIPRNWVHKLKMVNCPSVALGYRLDEIA
jgi:hypothetical protein